MMWFDFYGPRGGEIVIAQNNGRRLEHVCR